MNIGMYRPYKVLVSKDVNPNATGLSDLDSGELIVMAADGTPLVAGETVADSEWIYIAQGSNTANAGATGYDPIMSSRIKGATVTKWSGKERAAAAQQVSYVGYNGSITTYSLQDTDLSTNTTYKIMINFPFDKELRSLRTWNRTFEYTVGGSTTGQALAMTDDLAAQINADPVCKNYIIAAGGATMVSGAHYGLRLTGLAQTHGSYDNLDFVSFEIFLGSTWAETTTEVAVDQFDYLELAAGKTQTGSVSISPSRGVGTYDYVTDLERFALGFRGITNRTLFPVPSEGTYALSTEAYDMYMIEWTDEVFANDLSINKHLNQLIVAIPYDATNLNGSVFEGIMNPWMASCSGAFANVNL